MKVIAFGASNSAASINKTLAHYVAGLIPNADVELLDLNDFVLPLFSVDLEAEIGQPENAKAFFNQITRCDLIVVSFAEHNGSYTAAYKNLFDWCSRINAKVFQNKSMLMFSTSPGANGGKSVLAAALNSAPFFHGNVLASLSIPKFNENFDREKNTITNKEISAQIKQMIDLITV